MAKKLPVLDTNIIIRYLTNDTSSQAEAVEKLLKQVSRQSLAIPDLIIAEIIYVLLSYYQLTKSETIEKIHLLLDFPQFKTNKKLLKKTLAIFTEYNISFPDAYLCALNLTGKNSLVYTFDEKLTKIPKITAKIP